MKKLFMILLLAAMAAVLLCACDKAPEPTEPTTPVFTPSPTSEPTSEPTTESTEPPKQAFKPLTAEELAQFDKLFFAKAPFSTRETNYYSTALCVEFDEPKNLSLAYFFNAGFAQAKDEPITDAEWSFFEAETGHVKTAMGDLFRLPADWANGILDSYFAMTMEDFSEPLPYNPDTNSFYITPPGVLQYGYPGFHGGYYDEDANTISLHYYNKVLSNQEYVITLQSGRVDGGYYIVSNLPADVPMEPTEKSPVSVPEEPIGSPRQTGERLSGEDLSIFEQLFSPKAAYGYIIDTYYSTALCIDFDEPKNLNLEHFFNNGIRIANKERLTAAEIAFIEKAIGQELISDASRIPASMAEAILQFYFGIQMKDFQEPLLYNPDTDIFYALSGSALLYSGSVTFHDGYYDRSANTISLYYHHVDQNKEYIITLQPKRNSKEGGYYILSNLPVS